MARPRLGVGEAIMASDFKTLQDCLVVAKRHGGIPLPPEGQAEPPAETRAATRSSPLPCGPYRLRPTCCLPIVAGISSSIPHVNLKRGHNARLNPIVPSGSGPASLLVASGRDARALFRDDGAIAASADGPRCTPFSRSHGSGRNAVRKQLMIAARLASNPIRVAPSSLER